MEIKAMRLVIVYLTLALFFLTISYNSVSALSPEEERTAKLIEGAKKEGQLVLYTSLKDSVPPLIREFNKKYPFIHVQSYSAKSEIVLIKFLAEVKARRYNADVFAITSIVLEELKKKGLLMSYVSPESKIYPEGLKDPEGYWNSLYLQLRVVTYNTKLVSKKDLPKSYEDFLAPKWKGKIGMDGREYVWFASQLKIMGKEKGLDFMKKLSQQNLNFRGSKSLLQQLCAAGEFPIIVTTFAHEAEKYKKRGAPLDWFSIDPVVTGLNLVGVTKQAPHPNASKLFMDYVLSKEGQSQEVIAGQTASRPDVESVPSRAVIRQMKLFPVAPGVLGDYEEITSQFRNIFHKGEKI